MDSGVSSPAIAALPARSGCARISARRSASRRRVDDRDERGVQARRRCRTAARSHAAPAIQGDASNTPPKRATNASRSRRSAASMSMRCPIGGGYSLRPRERHRHRGLRDRHRRRRRGASTRTATSCARTAGSRRSAPVPRRPCPAGARRIDGRGTLATPGLVNCHHHLYQHATRGYAQQATLFEWLVALYPVWQHIDDAVVAAAARAGLAQLARSGCTHHDRPPLHLPAPRRRPARGGDRRRARDRAALPPVPRRDGPRARATAACRPTTSSRTATRSSRRAPPRSTASTIPRRARWCGSRSPPRRPSRSPAS